VTCRGLERRAIVRENRDREHWLRLLDRVAARRHWRVLAWALLDNHFHLFVRTPHADLSAGMHDLNSGYAAAFNRRHARVGPLFQGRFKGIMVESGRHEWELSRYIHLNPVRAGLAARPEEFPWSSCRHYFGHRGAPPWLVWEEVLCLHGRTVRAARRAYRAFLDEGLATRLESPLADVVGSTLLGSAGFVERMRAWLEGKLPDREVPAARALHREVGAEAVASVVGAEFGVSAGAENLRRRDRHSEARAAAIYLCRRYSAASVTALGAWFGGVGPSAITKAAGRFGERLSRDKRLAARVRRCARAIEQMSNVKT
jgi:REP element-mobilizing transposase RayT